MDGRVEQPPEGARQFGNYRLLNRLGKGGFAYVYLGEHIHLLPTKAAIKLLREDVGKEQEAALKEEARKQVDLKHPNIVRVLDFGVEDSTPYLVMDYAPGGSLRQRHPTGTRLPLSTVIEYVKQVAAALDYAHEHELIHSDVKPENMLVGDRNEVLLSDFGLAIILLSHHSSRISQLDDVGGTLRYMAPEVLKGRPRRASDQYSLGIVVYEWLCGTTPFESVVLAYQDDYPSIPPLHSHDSTIPSSVEKVVLKALARQPEKRFASVADFATALERASLDPHYTPSPPHSLISMLLSLIPSAHAQRKMVIRRRMLLGAGGLVSVGVLGAGIWGFTHPASSYQPPMSKSQGTLYLTYRKHSDAVEAIAWSPDGKRIASGSDDQTVQVWDVASGTNIFTYRGHPGGVRAVAWSPDGKRIASGSNDQTVQVWDPVNSGNVFATYRGHSHAVTAVAWSPDGKYIASGGLDQTVQVWNAANGAHIFTYTHSNAVTAVAWSPDGKYIASGSVDKTVHVHNSAHGSHVFTYRGHASYVYAVVWSPDSKRIASGSGDKTVQAWNAVDGANAFTYSKHSQVVPAVAWSPDGKRIASGSYDQTVQVWNAASGTNAFIYPGHTDAVLAIAWSSDSQRLASGGLDQTVQVWQA